MKNRSWLAFSIDRDAAEPVFGQICAELRRQVIAGEIVQGDKLPPTRVLATELGVSRSTIVAAYDQLVAEGYIEGQRGSAYVVCPMGDVELSRTRDTAPTARSETRRPTAIPFQAGMPDMRLFPYRQWARAVSRVARNTPEALVTGGGLFGDMGLRQAVVQHIAEWRGIAASPHQVLITAGSGDALEICVRALTRSGDTVGLENPGYMQLRNFVLSLGLTPEWLAIGGQGAELPRDRGPLPVSRLVILTPSHQFPLGGAMAPGRRLEYLAWAKRNQSWIIEDDYDSEFRYAGRPIPAMAGFDETGNTIYVGSFSKIFSNSLRLGYLVLPEQLIDIFQETLRRYSVKASLLPQRPLADFILDGEFYRHLRRVRRVYGERRRFFLKSLSERLGEYGSFEDHQAGMQIAFHLRPGLTDTDIEDRAAKNGISAQALSRYYADAPRGNGLLLGFCGFTEDELAAGLEGLASALPRQRTARRDTNTQ